MGYRVLGFEGLGVQHFPGYRRVAFVSMAPLTNMRSLSEPARRFPPMRLAWQAKQEIAEFGPPKDWPSMHGRGVLYLDG